MAQGTETTTTESLIQDCGLARTVEQIESALSSADYQEAERLFEADPAAVWFGFSPSRTFEVVELLVTERASPGLVARSFHQFMKTSSPGQFFNPEVLKSFDFNDPRQAFLISMFRMGGLRLHGRPVEALEPADTMRAQLGTMQSLFDSRGGLALHAAVQTGVTAMLAGDFIRAQASFTEAQLHVEVPLLAFLRRDAMAKAALIHACIGDQESAGPLIARADQIKRTTSWVEGHIDLHRDLVLALTRGESAAGRLSALEQIDLHDVGEMWPFYIVALHRAMVAADRHDELANRLSAFDSMPLPRVDGQGFTGSVLPLKRALLELENGRRSEAQRLIRRADPELPYTQLIEAVAHLYAGRIIPALQQAAQLREAVGGLRHLELSRLAVITAAQYLMHDTDGCVDSLKQAVNLPGGLSSSEILMFSPEVRRIAVGHIEQWPDDPKSPSVFLRNLPEPGAALSQRELQVLQQLPQGLSRADMAQNLYISLNTLKTQLSSIYRKLGVSSSLAALREAERRGLL